MSDEDACGCAVEFLAVTIVIIALTGFIACFAWGYEAGKSEVLENLVRESNLVIQETHDE